MLLEKWNLSLNGEHHIGQARRNATVRCDAGENPGAAFLIHQAARAVERIHEDSPATVLCAHAAREKQRLGKPLRDETDRLVMRQDAETRHESLFTDAIDRVDRVSFAVVAGCDRELLR